VGSLFRFLFEYRLFFLFILLEVFSFWMVITRNNRQKSAWLTSSNNMAAKSMALSDDITGFFGLYQENEKLARENARLNTLLTLSKQTIDKIRMDSMDIPATLTQYSFIVAKVINNSVSKPNNYITLNKGSLDGIKPGMGIISPEGVVGRVMVCSEHFSTATSMLHSKMLISAEISRIHASGSLKWGGNDPDRAYLEFVARHLKPKVGDTIRTSEFSNILPEGIHVGVIRSIKLKDDATFYNIEVDLATDFSSLNFVYVIENKLQAEKDSLQTRTAGETEW
jgi:rod shape-determining protein MreC